MERIDLKAAMKSTLLTVAMDGIGVCAKHNQRRRGIFCRRWSMEGEGGQMTIFVTIVREKEDRYWVWFETGVNPNRQPP